MSNPDEKSISLRDVSFLTPLCALLDSTPISVCASVFLSSISYMSGSEYLTSALHLAGLREHIFLVLGSAFIASGLTDCPPAPVNCNSITTLFKLYWPHASEQRRRPECMNYLYHKEP